MQNGNTLAHIAAEEGSEQTMELLLEEGVNVVVVNKVECCFATVFRLSEGLACI